MLVFDWFRRLVPKSADFFILFERHSASTVAAAEALSKLVRGEGEHAALVAAIRDHEHDADDVTREVLTQVRQTFLTPFDRGAIIGLIAAMDDVTDEIQSCASAIETYDFKDFAPDMQEMAAHICRALHKIDEALPLLRDVPRNGSKLHDLTGEIVRAEGEVDIVHERGLKANFAAANANGNTVQFIVNREIFKHLEKVADAFEDVANQIDGIVIDYA
jgi:predicted phosphate transport protein (TIGR00153 family)